MEVKTKLKVYLTISIFIILCITGSIVYRKSLKKSGISNFENTNFEVAVFAGGMGAKQWEELTKAFQKKYPKLEIKLTASPQIGGILLPRIITGDTPDFIVMMDENTSGLMAKMISNRLLLDITDVFQGESLDEKGTAVAEHILSGYMNNRKFMPYDDGKIYIAPQECGPRGLVYNKDLFEKKGWKVPITWEEFFLLGDEAKKEGRFLFTYPGIYPKYLTNILLPALAAHAGEEAVNAMFNYEKEAFLNPKVLEVLEQFKYMADNGYVLPYTLTLNHIQAQEKVLQGEALFIPTGPWIEEEMKDSQREGGFRFGITAAPVMNHEEKQYIVENYGQACIPAQAKNPEAAKEFLRFLYTKEAVEIYAKESNSVVAVKNGVEWSKPYISDDLYGMFCEMEQFTPILSDFAIDTSLTETKVKERLYNDGMTKLFCGQMTVNELAQSMERLSAQIRAERVVSRIH